MNEAPCVCVCVCVHESTGKCMFLCVSLLQMCMHAIRPRTSWLCIGVCLKECVLYVCVFVFQNLTKFYYSLVFGQGIFKYAVDTL